MVDFFFIYNEKNTMMKQRQSEMSSESNSTDEQTTVQQSTQQIDPSLSPVTRRKHEFRLARLQSEVMTRARSTLFGLGDVWKSKMNGVPQTPTSPGAPSTNTPPRSPKNQNAVKNTFEFFFPRKNKEASSIKIRKGNSENNLTLSQKGSSTNVKRNSDKQSKGHKSYLKTDAKSNKSSKRDDRSRRFSRNQSVDISEIYPNNHSSNGKRNTSEILSRSFDDGIHYLSDGCDDFRPRSYNDTFSFLDDFDNETRSIYDGDSMKRRPNTKHNERAIASPQPRHILFNDEDDVIFFKSSSCPDKSGKKSERHNYYDQASVVKPLPNSKDIPGILHTRGNSQNSKSQDSSNYHQGSPRSKDNPAQNQHAEKIISARLKIQPPSGSSVSNNSTMNSFDIRHVQNKVFSFPQNDPIRYDTLERVLYQDGKQSSSNPQRSISTVIIEEQERVIASGDNEIASRSKISNNEQLNNNRDSRKIVKKQPSFDFEQEHALTLPRATSTHSNKKGNKLSELYESSNNGDDNRVQRCSSLDLELEVIYSFQNIMIIYNRISSNSFNSFKGSIIWQ